MSETWAPAPDVFFSGSFEAYKGAKCLVTGGLGFIGSNLVRCLVALGAHVTVIDNRGAGQGANDFNLEEVIGRVDLRLHDIGREPETVDAVRDVDYVFNLAGKSSHVDSLEAPFFDMETNVRGQLVLLEALRHHAPRARVIYASTRSVYGAISSSPVGEDHGLRPTEVNSANKAAADLYHTAHWYAYGLSTVSLRLTNTYGPRMLMGHSRQGFINWFVRQALEGETIRLYGDGSQQRDMLYVDDAVEAFLLAGLDSSVQGAALNVATGSGVSLREIAESLVRLAGRGSIDYVPFPEEARRIEIGDFVANVDLVARSLGWRARTTLEAGLGRTLAYYTAHRGHYW
jgi:UDP-glucose 4-epimerase